MHPPASRRRLRIPAARRWLTRILHVVVCAVCRCANRRARATDNGNAATSIGLLRDAIDPQPTASARDYIAAYTHPLPAGTFNRPYVCARGDALTTQREPCSYDAPDLPIGGALFERTLTLDAGSSELIVERAVSAARSRARQRAWRVSRVLRFGPATGS